MREMRPRSGTEGPLAADKLAAWLNAHQPISCAVNGSLAFARDLFEKTGLVVYTVPRRARGGLACSGARVQGLPRPPHRLKKYGLAQGSAGGSEINVSTSRESWNSLRTV